MTAPTGKSPVPGSERQPLDRPPIGDVPGSEPVDVMITLRPDIDDAARDRVVRFLEEHGLTIEKSYDRSRSLHVRGTAAAMQTAFSVRLALYFGESGDQFRARSGAVYVPDDMAGDVTAVLGLDDRNTARPWHAVAPRAGGGAPLTPLQVAKAYQFPTSDGHGQTVGIIELGGAFTQKDLDAYLAGLMVPGVTVTVVPVMGAHPQPDGPNGADGEVMLDVEIIAALAPGANIRVYFGPNTTAGFLAAINQAVADGANVVSISWGGPESTWTNQSLTAYDQTFKAAVTGGCSVFAASGDNGSSDGVKAGGKHVDFPASSPHVTGCGGTRLSVDASGALATEVVWNDNPTSSAAGGGFSTYFAKPGYQTTVPGKKRGVPDVAGNADPVTGYPVRVDGQNFVIGGTSAVAPLMAGLTLRLNQRAGRALGDFNALAYPPRRRLLRRHRGQQRSLLRRPRLGPDHRPGLPHRGEAPHRPDLRWSRRNGRLPHTGRGRRPGDDGRRVGGSVPGVPDGGRRARGRPADLGGRALPTHDRHCPLRRGAGGRAVAARHRGHSGGRARPHRPGVTEQPISG